MNKIIMFLVMLFILLSCNERSDTSVIVTDHTFNTEEALKYNDDGIALMREGLVKEAETTLQQALKIEPLNPIIFSNLGLVARNQGKNDKSISYFKEALKISDSTYTIAAVNLSFSYLLIGESGKGVDIATYVIENEINRNILSAAYINRCLNFMDLGLCDVARRDFNTMQNEYFDVARIKDSWIDLKAELLKCDISYQLN